MHITRQNFSVLLCFSVSFALFVVDFMTKILRSSLITLFVIFFGKGVEE